METSDTSNDIAERTGSVLAYVIIAAVALMFCYAYIPHFFF